MNVPAVVGDSVEDQVAKRASRYPHIHSASKQDNTIYKSTNTEDTSSLHVYTPEAGHPDCYHGGY